MVALACDLELDKIVNLNDGHKWSWFRRYCHAARVAKSLINRTPLPQNFCLEVRKKVVDTVHEDADGIWEHEKNTTFKKEHDEQLLSWLNRCLNDIIKF